MCVSAENNNYISVLDFGGSLGSSYRQNKPFLRNTSIQWGVIEQKHFVEIGRNEFEDGTLKFFETIHECVSAIHPNFVLISGTLQYMEHPYQVLESILELKIPYILVDRTMARSDQSDEIAVQHVPEQIYKASYPLWFLNANRIEECFAKFGYKLIDRFDPCPGSSFGPEEQPPYPYMGWFFHLES